MPAFQSMSETIILPLWAAAAVAAVLALLVLVAVFRIGGRQAFGLISATVILIGLGWFVGARLDAQGRMEQRRAIEARLSALAAQALAPNSNLACLDAAGGNLVHEACERSLFSSPEQISAALNYVGARLDLMRELAALPEREEAAYDGIRAPIVRSLEADRFGLVAQVLTARDGCRPNSCYAFDLVQSRDQLVANMSERAYDVRVVRYSASWSDKPGGPVLASQSGSQPAPQSPPFHPVNINFPSSASIPPVSIMSNEPGMAGQNGVDPPAKSEQKAQPQQSPRRPAQKAQAPRPAAQPAPPPPAPAADPFPQPVGAAQQTTGAPAPQ
jgi:hypothetical protein